MKKIALLIVLVLSFFVSKAQIVNEGELKIESGTNVYFKNDFTNKLGATQTNEGELHVDGNYTNNGTHTNNGDLHLEGNFTNNGTTTVPTSGTTFFDGSGSEIQIIDGTTKEVRFYNLTVNNTHATVKGVAVSDQYDVQVDNILALTSGDLRLMGEAQLIQKHTGASANTGSGHLLKDQDGAKSAYRYNYWSSPVQVSSGNNTVAAILNDGSTPNLWAPATPSFITGYDGTVGPPIGLAAFWFYKYVSGDVDPSGATQGQWINLFNGTTSNTAAEALMLPGEGYTMKGTDVGATYSATQNYTFKGKPNDGDYTLTIANNKEYLVGNPYASALDSNLFIDKNIDVAGGGANPVIDGTLYYWHHWGTDTHNYTDYSAGYATYTKTGGTASTLHGDFSGGSNPPTGIAIIPQQYIPVGQGFIVRSETTAGGDITFSNDQRIFMLEGASSIPVKNTSKSNETVTARIRLDYIAPNERLRHLLLGYTETATDAVDYGWDGRMIDPWNDDLYYTIGEVDGNEDIPYIIQGVGAFDIDTEYPLVLKTATSGKHTIKIDELENFEQDLYILDEKGKTHDLRKEDYIYYSSTDDLQKNLKLVFKPASSPTDVQDNLNDFITAFYVKDEIVVNNEQDLILTGLQVYSITGQLVLQMNNNKLVGTQVRLPFSNFAKSAYVIKLQTKTGNGAYKFINY